MKRDERIFKRLIANLSRSTFLLLLGVAITAVTPTKLFAQANVTAEIVGTVTDPGGAVVPGADITVTNISTQEVRKVQSGANGDYDIPLLPPGTYSISVAKTAFKKFDIASITLAAGDKPRINASLAVGDTSQTVSVEATTPLLQSESATLQSSITPVTVQDLPLNGRNFIQLAQMVPGANEGPPNSLTNGTKPDDKRATASFSANGASEVLNNQMMDGMDNNEGLIGSVGIHPNIDAVAELRVETSVYSADTGRTGGAAVNVITKSGTNSFHGDVYEYFRNDVLNAFPYEFGAPNPEKQEWRQNQFGGSIGGPIIHNKTFFFGDYEGFRLVDGSVPTTTVTPTAFEETHPGNFTDQPAAVLAQPYNPTTGTSGADYGPGGIIPAGSLDPSGLDYLALYPAPQTTTGGTCSSPTSCTPLEGKYVGIGNDTQFYDDFDIRLDHEINQSNQLFGRYSYNNWKTWNPTTLPLVTVAGLKINPSGGGYSPSNDHNVSLSLTHTFSATLLAQVQVGFLRVVDSTFPAFFGDGNSVGPNVNTAYGMPGINISGFTSGLAHVGANGGYTALGGGAFTPLTDNSNAYQGLVTVTWTHGAHNFKFGGGDIRRHYLSIQSSAGLPQYTMADLGLQEQGVIFSVNRALVTGNPYYRRWEPSAYVQDDWHIASGTTLNLGLRYDILTPFSEPHDRISTWNMQTETIMVAGTPGVSSTANIRTWYGGVQPRIGISQNFGHGLVVHAGFGLAVYSDLITSNATPKNPPILATYGPYSTASALASKGQTQDYSAYAYLREGSPALGTADFQNINPVNPVGAVRAATDPNFQPGVDYQMTLNIQKDFEGNVITIGYSGALERHAPQSFSDINEPAPNAAFAGATTGAAYQAARPYYSKYPGLTNIGWYASEGSGSYHSLQASVARRLTHGLSYNINYTQSHNYDNMNGMSNQNGVNWGSYFPVSSTYDRGNSDIDLRDHVAGDIDYALPFGSTLTGVEAEALKGWQINLIGVRDSGQPFSVQNSTSIDGASDIDIGDRVNMSGNGYASNKDRTLYLNKAAFSQQAAGTLGNEQRNALYGPSFRHVDLSFIKTFPIREAVNLEFRAEGFNITNTANFLTPNATLQTGTFGTITALSAAYNPRLIQFAVKLSF